MKIGFLGGTFDPIHFGHLNLALRILEARGLDQVLFCPASLSPHKESRPPQASKENRCAMVACAIADIPQLRLCTIETEQENPCYTIDTVRLLQKKHENDQFHLILGEDGLHRLSEWKEVEALLTLAPPLIGVRHLPRESSFYHKDIKENFNLIPLMDISSAEIRMRLQKGLYCGHLLPANVLDYILSHQLYLTA